MRAPPDLSFVVFLYYFLYIFFKGIGSSVPGWRFNHLKTEKASSPDFFQQSLEIAKSRSSHFGPFKRQNEENKGVLLGLTLSAYSNSSPYSLEKDPKNPSKPAEYFAPMRLREYGDCEDVSWEVNTNFKELIGADFSNHPELSDLQKFVGFV